MAYLEATSITVLMPGQGIPGVPGIDKKERQKKEPGESSSVLDGDCDPCKFAFLLSGGADSANNHSKYWGNLVALYHFKVDSLGYCDSNVFVHYFKGDRRDDRIPAGRVVKGTPSQILISILAAYI